MCGSRVVIAADMVYNAALITPGLLVDFFVCMLEV